MDRHSKISGIGRKKGMDIGALGYVKARNILGVQNAYWEY